MKNKAMILLGISGCIVIGLVIFVSVKLIPIEIGSEYSLDDIGEQ